MICLTLNRPTLAENCKLLQEEGPYITMAELRADLLLPAEWPALSHFAREVQLPLILTCRRNAEGGCFQGEEGRRLALLRHHASAFDYLDCEHDLHWPEIYPLLREHRTRIVRSYHSFSPLPSAATIAQILCSLRHQPHEIAKIAVMAASLDDTANLIEGSRSDPGPKIALAMSEWGELSRILYRPLGSCWTYASPASGEVAPGQVSAQQLAQLYRALLIDQHTCVFAIVGNPVAHSASPAIHNPSFQAKGLNAVYIKIKCDHLAVLQRLAPLIKLRGFSLTTPHKEDIIQLLVQQQPAVKQIGSCNTVICQPQGWVGDNTDPEGIIAPLQQYFSALTGLRVCLIGSGGAARAAAFALQQAGAQLLILNRSPERAQLLAQAVGCEFGALAAGRNIPPNCQVLLQASSAGLGETADPIPHYRFCGEEIAFEMIYHPPLTRFLERAQQAGCRTIGGLEMLHAQAIRQQHIFAQACHE